MKKLILATAILSLNLITQAKITKSIVITPSVNEPKWKKSEAGTWMGANKTWYKLNPKDSSVWMSTDRKKWDALRDGISQDKERKWLKIVDKKQLKWSADVGKIWSEVPVWKWEAGEWYKFDSSWNFWLA